MTEERDRDLDVPTYEFDLPDEIPEGAEFLVKRCEIDHERKKCRVVEWEILTPETREAAIAGEEGA